MVTMTLNEWTRYRDLLKRLSDLAAGDFRDAVFKAGGKFGAAGLCLIPAAIADCEIIPDETSGTCRVLETFIENK